eukprot:7376666-Prymnesium_polylepis.2
MRLTSCSSSGCTMPFKGLRDLRSAYSCSIFACSSSSQASSSLSLCEAGGERALVSRVPTSDRRARTKQAA